MRYNVTVWKAYHLLTALEIYFKGSKPIKEELERAIDKECNLQDWEITKIRFQSRELKYK